MAQAMRTPYFMPEIEADLEMEIEKTSQSLELFDLLIEVVTGSSWSELTSVLLGFSTIYILVLLAGICG